jgi:UDP-N-acetyl-D-glucosamine dehydrogenase
MAISHLTALPLPWPPFRYDIAIVGLGHAGLTTALAFHAAGRSVLGIDVSTERLIAVGAGLVNLNASDRERLNAALTDDRFQLTADPAGLPEARSVVICVPTHVNEYFAPDLSAVQAACSVVAEHARPGQLLMLTSTTYVGCTRDLLVRPLTEAGMEVGTDVFVAFSAEEIDPDSPQVEQEAAPRVVAGATPECTERAVATLRAYATNMHAVPSLAIAEMTKLLENTFRAMTDASSGRRRHVDRRRM